MMDDLFNAMGSISIRKKLYKNSGRTPESARDKRRAELLEDYKKKRDVLLLEKRGLIEDNYSENVEWMDWDEPVQDERSGWYNFHCKNQLMLSEWLMDRPYDIETAWTAVVCPEGQRTLVIAKKGCTRAFHKNGRMVAKFKSILPSGAPTLQIRRSDVIILDCIWKAKTRQLFALDVLHWRNQPLLDTIAQFRLFWVKSKINELKLFDNKSKTLEGLCDVHLPVHCTLSQLPAVLAEHDPAEVDGILFYHNQAPYISGQTPLVGWLKPYMLPERFGLELKPEYMALKPANYIDLNQWVAKVGHTHDKHKQECRRRKRKKKNKDQMELDSSSTANIADVTGASFCEVEEIEDKSDVSIDKMDSEEVNKVTDDKMDNEDDNKVSDD